MWWLGGVLMVLCVAWREGGGECEAVETWSVLWCVGKKRTGATATSDRRERSRMNVRVRAEVLTKHRCMMSFLVSLDW